MKTLYSQKIQTFRDLIVWQEAHKLVLLVYVATRSFPASELYSLTDQIKRSAVSVTSNIAEGFGKRTAKEKIQFYTTSRASLIELQNQILIARDVSFLPPEKFSEVANQSVKVHKLLNGLTTATRNKRYES